MCAHALSGIGHNLTKHKIVMIFFLINQKNEGICYDDEETRKFSCNCTLQYLGERCEVNRFDFDPCDFYQCQNNGTCIVDVINGISTPICECPETHHGATCHLKACNIPCYNGGICDGDACQCSQDNGIAKYHGESCDMPAACDGNPCQNGGTCIIQEIKNIQACFIKKMLEIFSPIILKSKSIENKKDF